MKILIDARFYGLENAGLGRYTMNLVGQLQVIDKKNKYVILLRSKYYNNLNLPANWTKVLADFRHYTFSEQTRLPKLIRSHNPDIVHFLHFNAPVNFKGKCIITIHDLLMHRQKGKSATTLFYPKYLLKRRFYHFVFRKAVVNSSLIISPSAFVKKDIIDHYKVDSDKIEVIYEGVEKSSLKQKTRSTIPLKYNLNSDYFIYTGNAYPHKNIVRLIEAIQLINKTSSKPILLAIVSARNIFTQRLEKTIAKMHATAFVKLLGYVPDSDLNQLYIGAKAFIYPSLMEGFGLPGLEALSAGTLVLASDIPVFKEVYKDNVVYFNPFNFASIAEAMNEVIDLDPKIRHAAIARGQKFVQRYSWRKMAEQTLVQYEKFASDKMR